MGTLGTRMIAVSAVVGAAAVTGLAAPQALAAEPDGTGTVLATSLNGANEVPAGDTDGAALEFVRVKGDQVSVAVKWQGVGKPTALHLHDGAKGANGDVRVDFTKVLGNAKGHRVTGSVTVKDTALLGRLTADPGAFYANLHTAAFPKGAVRGQLHRVTEPTDFGRALDNFQASVVRGRQIYECKTDPATGKAAFAQRDVSAVLAGHIRHSFTAPNSGVPQWVAPDGSAVTGAVVSRTPNGDGNIAELDLKATQSGKSHGLLADTAEILRLNTVGGVAPSGSCDLGAIVGVPYKADYVFVNG
ncbi:CHRD domain-containing protein [Streptomyces sp. NBC_00006]|uniref:CHRD domain-containing protein n=1 Tax=Streptomyces sp. NBC_00006 TaxID=2975619 RepID=UPI00225BC01B|nr:CHRD domain-containing protein [Streptomyces sp. NBC_00006]MCX5531935.1 CHRD domain-containing protein [Streptomyces sp. NBC_00006]